MADAYEHMPKVPAKMPVTFTGPEYLPYLAVT